MADLNIDTSDLMHDGLGLDTSDLTDENLESEAVDLGTSDMEINLSSQVISACKEAAAQAVAAADAATHAADRLSNSSLELDLATGHLLYNY